MKRLLFLLCFLALLVGQAWAATETFYVCAGGDGSAPEVSTCATAWDVDDFNTAGNWASGTDANDGKIGANDDVIFLSSGGPHRGGLVAKGSGAEGKPITIKSTDGAVILGTANYSHGDGYNWAQIGSTDVYRLATVINAPYKTATGKTSHTEYNLLLNGDFDDWTTSTDVDDWAETVNAPQVIVHATATDTAYNAASEYAVGDLVDVSGTDYVCVVANGSGDPKAPATFSGHNDGTDYWEVVTGNIATGAHGLIAKNGFRIDQAATLEANTRYVLRITHKSTGGSTLGFFVNGAPGYLKADQSGWQAGFATVLIPNSSTFREDFFYFETTTAGTYNFRVTSGGTPSPTNQSFFVDDVIVIKETLMEPNFIVAKCSKDDWTARGFAALQRAERGIHNLWTGTSADGSPGMAPGEWTWTSTSNWLQYRLDAGETISTVHIEVAQGAETTSPIGFRTRSDASTYYSYLTVEGLTFAYFQTTGFGIEGYLTNHSDYITFKHNKAIGSNFASSAGPNTTGGQIIGNIFIDSFSYGTYVSDVADLLFANNVAYQIRAPLSSAGFSFYSTAANTTVKNNIVVKTSPGDWVAGPATSFTLTGGPAAGWDASNNLWYGVAPNATFIANKGTGNVENIDPLLDTDYSLLFGSPCIKAGTEAKTVGLNGVQTDIFSNTVTLPDRYNVNIGADLEKYGYVAPHIISGKILSGRLID